VANALPGFFQNLGHGNLGNIVVGSYEHIDSPAAGAIFTGLINAGNPGGSNQIREGI